MSSRPPGPASLALLLLGSVAVARAGGPPEGGASALLVEAMRGLPEHARPLYAVGDVDEDGQVERRDVELIRALARTPPPRWIEITEASCPAAADLDLDADVDAADAELAGQILGEGRIATPALFHQEALTCRFDSLIVAAPLYALRGEPLPIWILARGEDVESVRVTIEQGRAEVRRGADGRTIELAVGADQPLDEVVVARIVLGSGRAFLFSFAVSDPKR